MTSTDTYQLKWHSHSSHLNGSVASLLRSERFTDVVLCTMDGSQIPAHKFILSSCSVYLSGLFEGQRSVTRMGGMLYVVLPSEISTKALKILVEYMYKGETTVSNEVLDTVLKAGEVLKIRGLWRQTDEAGGDSTPAEKTTTTNLNKQVAIATKKTDESQPKIAVKKDDKLLKTFSPGQIQAPGGQVTRPMFIGPPKLVFIKTTEGGTQAALRPGAPKGQTILVAPAPTADASSFANVTPSSTSNVVATTTIADDSPDEGPPPPRILRRTERKYGKRQKTDVNIEVEENKDEESQDNVSITSKKSNQSSVTTEIQVKDEPDWDASSIEEEERSIAEMFQAEMSVKSEPVDDMDIEEESLIYSPLACELCAEVFTVPAAWVRHVQNHASSNTQHARKRKHRSASDDTEETMALLRCDLCQKHFPNPAEWVRHIQSTHTEIEPKATSPQPLPEEHSDVVTRQEFHTELQKYFKAHHTNSTKPEWTNERINKIIQYIEEYRRFQGPKQRTYHHYHYVRKYDVMNEGEKKILIVKPKTAKQRVRHIVPSSEFYDLILRAHLSTKHGRRDKVMGILNRVNVVPTFAVKIFLDLCKICKAKKENTKPCNKLPVLTNVTGNAAGNDITVASNVDVDVSRTSNIGYDASGSGNPGYVESGGSTAGFEVSIAGNDINHPHNVGCDGNVAGNPDYIVSGASNVGYVVSATSNVGYAASGTGIVGYAVSETNNVGNVVNSNIGYAVCYSSNVSNDESDNRNINKNVPGSSSQLHSSFQNMAVVENIKIEFTREKTGKDKEPVEELATLSKTTHSKRIDTYIEPI